MALGINFIQDQDQWLKTIAKKDCDPLSTKESCKVSTQNYPPAMSGHFFLLEQWRRKVHSIELSLGRKRGMSESECLTFKILVFHSSSLSSAHRDTRSYLYILTCPHSIVHTLVSTGPFIISLFPLV